MRIRERFNPRAPCGARRHRSAKPLVSSRISTHAPLAGRDGDVSGDLCAGHKNFNPRAPCGARPGRARAKTILTNFNPRAPCGARLPPRQAPSSMPYFNPCAPCGARRRRFGVARAAAGFQPTRPLRGATPHVLQVSGVGCISTHAPLAGRDRIARTLFPSVSVFQPTRPLRGATIMDWFGDTFFIISTHAPLAGRDF